MSVNKDYYVIAGYDLTRYKTEAFEDWKWTDEGKKFHCYQRKGQIQLFYDPMGDSHLYFGYILAHGDEYSCPTEVISLKDVCEIRDSVEAKVKELWELGVIDKECRIMWDIKSLPLRSVLNV